MRRNHIFFALWLAPAGLFIPLVGVVFYSSFSFFKASFYTLTVISASFLLTGGLIALMSESMRILAANRWKKGDWISVVKRRENRFGKRVVQRN